METRKYLFETAWKQYMAEAAAVDIQTGNAMVTGATMIATLIKREDVMKLMVKGLSTVLK